MKILGINGSPRKNGNSDILLTKALKAAEEAGAETEKIYLDDLDISPCKEEEYGSMDERGFSVVKDDMEKIFLAVEECDGIILASPVFFGSVSGQVKIMIDRFQSVWTAKNVFKKEVYTKKIPGAFLCVEASDRKDFFDNAVSIVKNFFVTINAEYTGELLCTNCDEKGSVTKHPDFLKKAADIGKCIASCK